MSVFSFLLCLLLGLWCIFGLILTWDIVHLVYNSFGDANNKLIIHNPGKPWEQQSPFLPELYFSRNEDYYSWSNKTHWDLNYASRKTKNRLEINCTTFSNKVAILRILIWLELSWFTMALNCGFQSLHKNQIVILCLQPLATLSEASGIMEVKFTKHKNELL